MFARDGCVHRRPDTRLSRADCLDQSLGMHGFTWSRAKADLREVDQPVIH